MTYITVTFKIHQHFQLRSDYHFFHIGSNHDYVDVQLDKNNTISNVKNIYLPACTALLHVLNKQRGKFKVNLLISGTALDQFEQHSPKMIAAIKDLVGTGCVELITTTYHNSFAGYYSVSEFVHQANLHHAKVYDLFGYRSRTFCNTAQTYNDNIASLVQKSGYSTLLADERQALLEWRSPNYVYMPSSCYKTALLLFNKSMSDDLRDYFSKNNNHLSTRTIVERYTLWLQELRHSDIINLLIDLDTLKKSTFSNRFATFINTFSQEIINADKFQFITSQECAMLHEPIGKIFHKQTPRAPHKWLGNDLQKSAVELIYSMDSDIESTNDQALINDWRRLSCADHFQEMSNLRKGNVYATPQLAYIALINALNDVRFRIDEQLESINAPCHMAKPQKGSNDE